MNVQHNGGYEFPPSTLAANIVNNFANTRKPTRKDEEEDLQRLVHEIEEAEKADGETDRDVKIGNDYKLIYVVAKAVFGQLASDSPFVNKQQLLQQVSEGLDLIISTIKETPETLAHDTTPKSHLGGAVVPLWIWLFPQFLQLLGKSDFESLQGKIEDFFSNCFNVVSYSRNLWALNTSFFYYLRNCAEGTLTHLRDTSIIGPSTVLVLPLGTIDFDIILTGRPDLQQEGCTYKLRDIPTSLRHAAILLSIIGNIFCVSAVTYNATPALQAYLIWFLDSFLVLQEVHKVHCSNSTGPLMEQEILYSSISSVIKLLTELKSHLSKSSKQKAERLLVQLCTELCRDPNAVIQDTNSSTICGAMSVLCNSFGEDQSTTNAILTHLVPAVHSINAARDEPAGLQDDFQDCIRRILALPSTLDQAEHVAGPEVATEDSFSTIQADDTIRPAKRRKTGSDNELLDEIIQETNLLLGGQAVPDIHDLSKIAATSFVNLSNQDRSRALKYLGCIPCAQAKSLVVTRDENNHITSFSCKVCNGITEETSEREDLVSTKAMIATMESLIESKEFERSRRPRVMAAFVIRNVVTHSSLESLVGIETSILGGWIQKWLRSSMRELRIAAGRTLPVFLKRNLRAEVLASNQRLILNELKKLSDESAVHIVETCILAWGQVGRVSKDEELNVILHQLVKYLGNTNQVISGVAFNEILLMAESFHMPAGHMFRPFWRHIAPTTVQDLQARPQTAQLMADALVMSVSELLVTTQVYTLPWLILWKKRDVIVRIAEARRDKDFNDPWRICFENTNMAAIMAHLLEQNVPDLEDFIMDLMRYISPYFENLDLLDLLKIQPIGIALELLKNAGEASPDKKPRIRYGLQILAKRICSAMPNFNSKKSNLVGPFLEQYILGIISHFSDILIDIRGGQSSGEKRRSLKGLEELIRVGKTYIISALPQICACLQTALGNPEHRTTAFSAWVTMVKTLEDEDVSAVLENTFATIILHWEGFDVPSRESARGLIKFLYLERRELLKTSIALLPSLQHITELADCELELRNLRKDGGAVRQHYHVFSQRISHEHSGVVVQALNELAEYLRTEQGFIQASAVSEQPDRIIGELTRSILDACVKFGGNNSKVALLSAKCLGLIGCLDSNRVDAVRERKDFVVKFNFTDSTETTDFVLFILQEVIVPAFLSATNPRAQGFLSYAMQELLEKCDFKAVCLDRHTLSAEGGANKIFEKWNNLPDTIRATLTPFLRSHYVLTDMIRNKTEYPIFKPEKNYSVWLKAFVLDLLEEPCNPHSMLIFTPLCRIIRIEDTSVASFLLPYAVLHAVVAGTDEQRDKIGQELLRVLEYDSSESSHHEVTNVRLCSEAVFRIFDYMSRWAQLKQELINQEKGYQQPKDNSSPVHPSIQRIQDVLSQIPPELISRRAIECKSYARALFHWEQHIRQVERSQPDPKESNRLLQRLQDIYTQIDEPDGIEGISSRLKVIDIDQQILVHRKAGRWTAVQSWYEIKLAEEPQNADVQADLLHCLKESGQHDVLLNYVEGMQRTNSSSSISRLLPFATEASWSTGRWDALQKYLSLAPEEIGGDFNLNIGRVLLMLHKKDKDGYTRMVNALREHIGSSMSVASTASLGTCHEALLKFHAITDIEMICGAVPEGGSKKTLESLENRMQVVGSYLNDKQYLLGIRRAAMQLVGSPFEKADIAASWLTSARLARKGNSMHQSFNAVLHASQLGDAYATIEHARLLWKEGHARKAIQNLQGAIESNTFISHNLSPKENQNTVTEDPGQQNLVKARAHLLLAKWQDTAGQTHSLALRLQYQTAAKLHTEWEKGHYYLGRHFNKLLESQKSLAPHLQSQDYLVGQYAKLVVENYLRSLSYGTKYIYQTLPRLLTLWLDLGASIKQPIDPKLGTKEFMADLLARRQLMLNHIHSRFSKYIQKMPAYLFYTAFPQIMARIAHPNPEVYEDLQKIIVKVVESHPQQALWSLLAVSRSTQPDRKLRGTQIMANLRKSKNAKWNDLRLMIQNGERFVDQLLVVCQFGDFGGHSRTFPVSITRDLGFKPKTCLPSLLAMPMEANFTATLPTLTDSVKDHQAFSRDIITIQAFEDEVLVLSSLAKPRKLTALGSDGAKYGFLCKPKDDLRKDQRLMEFNTMINRIFKRDAESSKRQLYIRTYSVTPLNEECGILEWVNGLKTVRDILLGLYKARGISPNYGEIKQLCEEASKDDKNLHFYTKNVLGTFPPVLHLWFVSQFPDPSAWFTARLRYTRSCAAMSMVGTILGLGDRHGENILLEEGNGGTFHVDFNCLFDKGLTFTAPEKVPFRLTHNMVDAMGIYGYEGPFRRCSELTLSLLRQHEETLMTILEAFVYDPTIDLLEKKKDKSRGRDRSDLIAAPTPQGVLDAIRRKTRGLLAGESVPLGVEGQVDELIKQAVSHKNLAAMYIGWCSFF